MNRLPVRTSPSTAKVITSESANQRSRSTLAHIAPGHTRVRAGGPLPYVSSHGLSWGAAVGRSVCPESKIAATALGLVRPRTEARDGAREWISNRNCKSEELGSFRSSLSRPMRSAPWRP